MAPSPLLGKPWGVAPRGMWVQQGLRVGGIPTWTLCSRINGQCQDMEVVLQKTPEPGRYTVGESWRSARPCTPTSHGQRGLPA